MREIIFNNNETTAKGMGLAIDASNRTAYYVSMAAAGTAAQSVWASLVNRQRRVTARGWHAAQFNMSTPTTRVAEQLPNTVEQHWLIRSLNPGLVLIDDPRAATASYDDRQDLIRETQELVYRQMTDAINAVTKVPWPYEWTETLMRRPPYYAWTSLECYGDALIAYVVNPTFEWIGHAQEGLRTGRYYIPPQPLVERVTALAPGRLAPCNLRLRRLPADRTER